MLSIGPSSLHTSASVRHRLQSVYYASNDSPICILPLQTCLPLFRCNHYSMHLFAIFTNRLTVQTFDFNLCAIFERYNDIGDENNDKNLFIMHLRGVLQQRDVLCAFESLHSCIERTQTNRIHIECRSFMAVNMCLPRQRVNLRLCLSLEYF